MWAELLIHNVIIYHLGSPTVDTNAEVCEVLGWMTEKIPYTVCVFVCVDLYVDTHSPTGDFNANWKDV